MEFQIYNISFNNRIEIYVFKLNFILFKICIEYIYNTITLEIHKIITNFLCILENKFRIIYII